MADSLYPSAENCLLAALNACRMDVARWPVRSWQPTIIQDWQKSLKNVAAVCRTQTHITAAFDQCSFHRPHQQQQQQTPPQYRLSLSFFSLTSSSTDRPHSVPYVDGACTFVLFYLFSSGHSCSQCHLPGGNSRAQRVIISACATIANHVDRHRLKRTQIDLCL